MKIEEISKLVVCVLVIISATMLLMTKSIISEAGVCMITAALGYVFGNGHGVISSSRKRGDE